MKTAILWKTKTNRAGDSVNIRVQSFRRALKARGTISMKPSCGTFWKLLTTYAVKWTEANLMNSWPQKKSPLQVPIGFHIVSGLRVALFRRSLPRAELFSFPDPPMSTTMAVLWDRRRHFVHWHCGIATARFSPRWFAEAFNGTPWVLYIHLRDVSHPGKWRITFSR